MGLGIQYRLWYTGRDFRIHRRRYDWFQSWPLCRIQSTGCVLERVSRSRLQLGVLLVSLLFETDGLEGYLGISDI